MTNFSHLTTSEAAKLMSISDATVKRRCADGTYPGAFRSGRGWLIPRTSLPIGHDEPTSASRPTGRRDPILDELDTFPPAVTIQRTADFLQMSQRAVANMLKTGQLREVRSVRIVRVATPSIRSLLIGESD